MKSSRRADALLSSTNPMKQSSWYDILSPEQKIAADFVIEKECACLLCEQGTGKTIISLAVLEKLQLPKVLIVTPLTSIEVTWAKRLRQKWDVYFGLEKEPGVNVVGFEFFRNNIKKIIKIKWDMVIIDESQGLKDRGSKQSRAARRLRHLVKRRLILSGTPIDDSPIDMWAQLRFVDPSILGDVWGDFDAEFLRPTGFMGHQREMRPGRTDEFLKRVAPACFRLTIDELQEPPEFVVVPVRLFGEQRRIYERMNETGVLRIDGHKIKAGLKITQDLRLHQIVGGFVGTDDGYDLSVGQAKQRKLRWLLKKLARPVVFCRFLSELDEIEEILKERFERVGRIDGSVKNKKKDPARDRVLNGFQNGEIDALGCQARTGGVSIELHSGNELIFYSIGYSYIDFQQIISRFRRFGQKKRVKVFLLVAQDTIDEEPLERITSKGETVNPIMDYIKEHSMSDEKKQAKKAVKKTVKKAPAKKKEAAKEFKYGVDYLAEKTGLAAATVRIKLRDLKVKKEGKSYGWNSQTEADAVAKKLKAE